VIDLRLEPLTVDQLVFAAGNVPFRKSGETDRESAAFPDALHELIQVFETAFGLHELL
jgi:hypothetical protein